MELQYFLTKLRDNLLRIDFTDEIATTFYIGFEINFDIISLIGDGDFSIEKTEKTFDKNGKTFLIYQLQLKNDNTVKILDLIIKLNETYLERQKLIDEFNRKKEEKKRELEKEFELSEQEIDEQISEKFNSYLKDVNMKPDQSFFQKPNPIDDETILKGEDLANYL